MPRRVFAVGLALALVAGMSCDFGESGEDPGPPRRTPLSTPTGENSRVIALVGTLSGRDAWRGEDALEGADMAVGLLNRGLGPTEQEFELITLDDRGKAERATRLINGFTTLDQAVGVVYAGPPEGLPPAEKALARAGIPALLLYGDLYGARELSSHVFQVGSSYVWGARRLVSYFLRDRAYEKIGMLAEDSFSGDASVAAVRDALDLYGGNELRVVTYSEDVKDFAPHLDRLEKARTEALVVQASPGVFEGVVRALIRRGAVYKTTDAARTASLPVKQARRLRKKKRERRWRPQLGGFDFAISPSSRPPPPGTVAAETYGRGAHYLPLPELDRFREQFEGWWDAEPQAWEQRAYEAVRALGWAVDGGAGADIAAALEKLRGRRFGSLDVTLGPDDHTFVGSTTVGLWVVPRPDLSIRGADDLPDSLPWVLLSRGFSIDGETTDILPQDWRHLFKNPPPPDGPAPEIDKLRYGVATPRRDPVH